MWIMPTPRLARSRMIVNSSSISESVRAAVGSSRIRIRRLWDTAFAISTICCLPTESSSPGLVRIDIHLQPAEKLLRAHGSARVVQKNAIEPGGFPANEDILGHREVIHHVQFLVYDPDAHLQGVLGVPWIELVSEIADFTRVLRVDADQDLHESGFAGAILPDKGVDFCLVKVEIHVAQRVHPGKALVDSTHGQDLVAHCLARFRFCRNCIRPVKCEPCVTVCCTTNLTAPASVCQGDLRRTW